MANTPRNFTDLVTFTRASTAGYRDSTGARQTAAINVARFDHTSAGVQSGFRIEEQRTNLVLNSATLSTQSVTVTAAAHTLAFEGTGTVTLSGASTAGPLVGTGANDRVTLTFTPTAGSLTLTVSGTVSNAQLELGSFATSYIPTTSAQVTRSADSAIISGAAFTPWFNPLEGTIYIEAAAVGRLASAPFVAIQDSAGTTNYARIRQSADGASVLAQVSSSAGLSGGLATTAHTPGTFFKVALAIKGGDCAASVNGGAVGTSATPASLGTMDRLIIGSTGSLWLKTLRYYPQRLTNAQLVTLTS